MSYRLLIYHFKFSDLNIVAALNWAEDLGEAVVLPDVFEDKEITADLVNTIDKDFGTIANIYFYMKEERKNEMAQFLNKIASVTNAKISGLTLSTQELSNVVMRLWGSCILTGKFLDFRRQLPADERKKIFEEIILPYADSDPVFLQGLKSAPVLAGIRGEKCSYKGIEDLQAFN